MGAAEKVVVAAEPIIRWAGGKRRLLGELLTRLPKDVAQRNYAEPFFGGGALFFALADRLSGAVDLIDTNADLMVMYRAVRDTPEEVITWLERLAELHAQAPADLYESVRAEFNSGHDPVLQCSHRAAIFIYLNKTCFNGLWRVNKSGAFNVPRGTAATLQVDAAAIRGVSAALQATSLNCGDFEDHVDDVNECSFVYLDPPYVPASKTANFTAYAKDGFTGKDHVRLAAAFRRAHARGAKLLLSNRDTPLVHELYAGFRIERLAVRHSISADAGSRGYAAEVLIRNY